MTELGDARSGGRRQSKTMMTDQGYGYRTQGRRQLKIKGTMTEYGDNDRAGGRQSGWVMTERWYDDRSVGRWQSSGTMTELADDDTELGDDDRACDDDRAWVAKTEQG